MMYELEYTPLEITLVMEEDTMSIEELIEFMLPCFS